MQTEADQISDQSKPAELDWDDVDLVDLIGLDIGYGLIPLVNTETGGQLLSRVKGVRKKIIGEIWIFNTTDKDKRQFRFGP